MAIFMREIPRLMRRTAAKPAGWRPMLHLKGVYCSFARGAQETPGTGRGRPGLCASERDPGLQSRLREQLRRGEAQRVATERAFSGRGGRHRAGLGGDASRRDRPAHQPRDQGRAAMHKPSPWLDTPSGHALPDNKPSQTRRTRRMGGRIVCPFHLIALRMTRRFRWVRGPCFDSRTAGARCCRAQASPVAGRDPDPDRQPRRIDSGMDPGGQPAPGLADGVSVTPPFARWRRHAPSRSSHRSPKFDSKRAKRLI